MKDRLVILGGGGHAKVIIDILQQVDQFDIVGFTSAGSSESINGCRYLGSDDVLTDLYNSGVRSAFVAIGGNKQRKNCLESLRVQGFSLINAISQGAYISKHVSLGCGVVAMPGAVVNAGTRLDDGVIVNTNASVDHDCTVGACAHVAPGVAVAGCVRLGEGVFLGAGSSVIPNITIGRWTTVGAGAVVVRNLPDHVVAVGVPAIVRGEE